MKNMLLVELGDRIRDLRKKRGLSQEKLALRADIHPTYLGRIERGEVALTIITLHKIAKALEVSLGQFFLKDKQESLALEIISLLEKIDAKSFALIQKILEEFAEITAHFSP
ncbi:MAG: helix-turn-helix transcriptional regulator [bacterium]